MSSIQSNVATTIAMVTNAIAIAMAAIAILHRGNSRGTLVTSQTIVVHGLAGF